MTSESFWDWLRDNWRKLIDPLGEQRWEHQQRCQDLIIEMAHELQRLSEVAPPGMDRKPAEGLCSYAQKLVGNLDDEEEQ